MPDLTLALLVLAPLAAVELAKAARWAALFGPGRPGYARCLQALISGQLTNLLSPVRAGEVVQVGVVTLRGGALMPAAAALVGGKLLDGAVLLLLAGAIVGTASLGSSTPWLMVALTAGLVGLGIAGRGHEGAALLRQEHAVDAADRAGDGGACTAGRHREQPDIGDIEAGLRSDAVLRQCRRRCESQSDGRPYHQSDFART